MKVEGGRERSEKERDREVREGWRDKGREGGKGRRWGESKYVVVWVYETMHQLIHSTILSHRHAYTLTRLQTLLW